MNDVPTRSEWLKVRLTPGEMDDLRASAKTAGMTVADFARSKIWDRPRVAARVVGAIDEQTSKPDYELRVKQLARTMPLSTAKRIARLENP